MQKNLQNLLSLKEFCIKKLVFYVLFTIVTGTLELNVNKREMEVNVVSSIVNANIIVQTCLLVYLQGARARTIYK